MATNMATKMATKMATTIDMVIDDETPGFSGSVHEEWLWRIEKRLEKRAVDFKTMMRISECKKRKKDGGREG